jgi:HEAT repeat protein
MPTGTLRAIACLMLRLAACLAVASLAVAEPDQPAELPPIPKDTLAEKMEPALREAFKAAWKKYRSANEADREAAVAMIARIPDPLADTALVQIGEVDGHALVRLRAAEALVGRENPRGPMCAAKIAVCGAVPSIRALAADVVRKTGNKDAAEALLTVLKVGALKNLEPQGLGFNTSYNDISDLVYRTLGAAAVGRLATEDAVKALKAALGEPRWELRAAAARALADTGRVDAVPPLLKSVHDPDLDVAIESALALGRLGGADAELKLAALGKDKRPLLARMAARALRHAQAQPGARPAGANPPAGGGGTASETVREPTRAVPPPIVESPEGSWDLVFLIDSTFSMLYEWPTVRCQIQSEILRRCDDGDVRVGFVLFRDFNNRYMTRQMFLSWDLDKADKWFWDETPAGGNAGTGSASDRALLVATMMNLRPDHRPKMTLMADVPPNSLEEAKYRARLLRQFERGIVDAIYVDRDTETRGGLTKIAEAGGGLSKAMRSGASPLK